MFKFHCMDVIFFKLILHCWTFWFFIFLLLESITENVFDSFFLFLTYVKEFISWIIPELQWPNQRDVKYIFFHRFSTNCSPKKVRMALSLLTRWDSACSLAFVRNVSPDGLPFLCVICWPLSLFFAPRNDIWGTKRCKTGLLFWAFSYWFVGIVHILFVRSTVHQFSLSL